MSDIVLSIKSEIHPIASHERRVDPVFQIAMPILKNMKNPRSRSILISLPHERYEMIPQRNDAPANMLYRRILTLQSRKKKSTPQKVRMVMRGVMNRSLWVPTEATKSTIYAPAKIKNGDRHCLYASQERKITDIVSPANTVISVLVSFPSSIAREKRRVIPATAIHSRKRISSF